jgi:hypothetical protein
MRRIGILGIAAVVLFAMMPDAPQRLPPAPAGAPAAVRGVIHVHTSRSDGTGSVDDVVRAAASAGLTFVIVTDHGDGTRTPDLPDYRRGVLYIDAVEISTTNGHLVALGLPKSPYPLAGDARDVVEDVHRMGGLAIAAHPGSPRRELQWTDWTVPVDGLEWLNADSEWRDEQPWTLARVLFTYPFRPAQALALLLDRPQGIMQRWDALARQRPVFGIPAADAHARVGVRSLGEPYDTAGSLHFPSYANSFREFSFTLPDVALTGDAVADARIVLDGIRRGAFYSTIDALAGPAELRISASGGGIRVNAQAPDGARIELLRNGTIVATGMGGTLERGVDPAVYRVEVMLPDAPGTPPVPWMVSNPMYLTSFPEVTRSDQTSTEPKTVTMIDDGGSATAWTIEKSADSDAAIDVVPALPGAQLLLRFAISGSSADSPYAAFVRPATPAIAMYDRLLLTARANRPMRISVQLRGHAEGERWRRSVYLDQSPRTVDLRFADFRPASGVRSDPPVLSRVESVLFVIDTVNTKIGSNGQIQIDDIRYAR